MLNVYYMTADTVSPEMRDAMLAGLSPAEAKHCKRMKKEKDFLLSLCGHYMMKSVTGKSDVLYTPAGKPYYKDGPFVSLSHDENTVVLLVCDRPCGVDILFANEARKAKISQVVGRFIHDIYKGRSLSAEDLLLYRFDMAPGIDQLTEEHFSSLPEDNGEYTYAKAFTKAEALMKCDGSGFAAITLLCQLEQKIETAAIAIPTLKDSVITVARALPKQSNNRLR